MATPTYHARMTTAGAVAEAVAHMNGATLRFTHMAVGDGQYPVPDPNRTSLVSEKWRGPVNRVFINPKRADQLLIELVVPNEVGGFFIRELGLFNSDGILCAIAKVAENYKPLPSEGQSRHSIVRMVIKMAHAEVVEIKIDGSGGFVPLDVYNAHVGSRGEAHGVATEALPGFMSAQDKAAHNALRAAKPVNQVFAGPAGGGPGAPAFRALVAADIPGLDFGKIISGKPNTRDGWGIVDVPLSNGSGASGTWGINISGTARRLAAQDTRDQADLPRNKLGWALALDFKTNTSAGNPGITASGLYSHIVTVAGYDADGGSGGWPSQLSFGDGLAVRQGLSANSWGPWRNVLTNKGGYIDAGRLVIARDGQSVANAMYSAVNLELKTLDGGPAGIGLHRGGYTAATIYHATGDSVRIRHNSGVDGEILTTANINSYVPYKDGTGAGGLWPINIAGTAANASAIDNVEFQNANASNPINGADGVVSNGIGYVQGISILGQTDGALYSQAYGPEWMHQIYGDYRSGQIAVRGKSNNAWGAWRAVLDATNYTNYAVPKTGGTFSGAVGIHSTTPALVMRDTDTSGANIVGYVEFADSGGAQRGWMGFGNADGTMRMQNTVGQIILTGAGAVRSNAPSGFETAGWFRSEGATGWYNASFGGGIHMTDSNYVRVYNGKGFVVDGLTHLSANVEVGGGTAEGQVRINYAGQPNQSYLYRNGGVALGGHNNALGNLFSIDNSRNWNLPATLNVAGAVNAATPHAAADDSQLATTAWVNAKGFPKLSEFAVNLSASGWQRLPSGLILQWGRVTEATYDADYRYFPLAFPSACVGVLFSLDDATTQGFSGNNGTVVKIVDRTKFLWDAGGTWAGGGVGYFFAIGW